MIVCDQILPFIAPAPTNNIALVVGQTNGSIVSGVGNSQGSISLAFPGNVTNGNVALVGISLYDGGIINQFANDTVTKSAGTATIGSASKDATSDNTSTTVGVGIYRVPITGSGSLTLQFSTSITEKVTAIIMAIAEFSGFNVNPLDAGATGVNDNGGTASTHHTTTALSSSVPGLIWYCASEFASNDFTRTFSDTSIYHHDTPSVDFSGIVQYRLITDATNTLTDDTGSESAKWKVAYATYKTS